MILLGAILFSLFVVAFAVMEDATREQAKRDKAIMTEQSARIRMLEDALEVHVEALHEQREHLTLLGQNNLIERQRFFEVAFAHREQQNARAERAWSAFHKARPNATTEECRKFGPRETFDLRKTSEVVREWRITDEARRDGRGRERYLNGYVHHIEDPKGP